MRAHLPKLAELAKLARLAELARPVVLLALLAGLAAGCGPVAATQAIGAAEEALAAAETERAQRLAPYPYWMARSYLGKAKLTEGYSEFVAAERFALQAADYAKRASDEAREQKMRQEILDQRLRRRARSSR